MGYRIKMCKKYKVPRNETDLREAEALQETRDELQRKHGWKACKRKHGSTEATDDEGSENTRKKARTECAEKGEETLQQACWFGHSQNARRACGTTKWYKNTWPTLWWQAPSGCRLCSKCYHTALRQRAKGLTPKLPVDHMNFENSEYNKWLKNKSRDLQPAASEDATAATGFGLR